MTKSVMLGIIWSAVLRAAVVVKLVTLSILPLTSFILALKVKVVANLVTLSILSSIYFILAL